VHTVATTKENVGVPRLALSPDEAAAALSVSRDFFDQHVGHEIKFVRRGRRKLYAVAAISAWLERESSLAVGDR
jgi:hypothetical protein